MGWYQNKLVSLEGDFSSGCTSWFAQEAFGPGEKSNLIEGSAMAVARRWNILICLFLHSPINRAIGAHVYSQKMRPGHTFQSASAPAHKLNSRDFPFQRVEKGYNITSFGVRESPWRNSFKRFLI